MLPLAVWWRAGFAPDALLVLRFEDLVRDPRSALARVAAHLDLGAPFNASLAAPRANPTAHGAGSQMLPSTRALLLRFYAPYNRELARRLGDPCFEWPDAESAPQCHGPARRARRARLR